MSEQALHLFGYLVIILFSLVNQDPNFILHN